MEPTSSLNFSPDLCARWNLRLGNFEVSYGALPVLQDFLTHRLAVLNGVILSAGVALTIARLAIRYSRGKLWWDDYWAILAAACGITYMVGGYVFLSDHGTSSSAVSSVVYFSLTAEVAISQLSRRSLLPVRTRVSACSLSLSTCGVCTDAYKPSMQQLGTYTKSSSSRQSLAMAYPGNSTQVVTDLHSFHCCSTRSR